MSKNDIYGQNGGVPSDAGGGQDAYNTDDESTPLTQEYGENQRSQVTTKAWDVFQEAKPERESGSDANQRCVEITAKITKIVVTILVFGFVLAGGVSSKVSTFFMTSQLKRDRLIVYCNRQLGRDRQFVVQLPEEDRIAWMWCLFIAYTIPELGTMFRSVRMCIFKKHKRPSTFQFIFVMAMETCHSVGLALMIFSILPDLDAIRGVMITNCVCFVPALLGFLSRSRSKNTSQFFASLIDLAALGAQASSFVIWGLFDDSKTSATSSLWLIPTALILVSCGWWENYVSDQSSCAIISSMAKMKRTFRESRYFTYMFVSLWKIIIFFTSSLLVLSNNGENIGHLFSMMKGGFRDHKITVQAIRATIGGTTPDLLEIFPNGETETVNADPSMLLYVLAFQILGAYCAYIFGKFACKIFIQGFSYALPVSLTVPVTICVMIAACGLRNSDPCFFHGTIPDYLFFEPPPLNFLDDLITKQYGWFWLLWLLSQTWVTRHIWTPKCERLASTEKLFVTPMYNALLIDQSLGMNRTRDDQPEVKVEDVAEMIDKDKADGDYETIYDQTDVTGGLPISGSDYITRIFACATMWHENKEEMMEFLKSILRMDEDQNARRIAQKEFRVVDPDYYEFETHIFFDDAFELTDHDDNEVQVNRFVKLLISCVDEAAAFVHRKPGLRVKSPVKYVTPYGGKLEWTLPGKTKMIAHLKDKSKIRHRKRWSQVMYMYYLLGHRVMEQPWSVKKKELYTENMYILTLDGDIDFQPSAVRLLVDLMKKNKNLGAACGRIHPVGSGPMVWYQKFEYAIGHWLQKATEHMIGCVLCSPGCFSLFRGKALIDYGVMKTYTTRSEEARHYVQYDQGEDRWLCTLLLQRGYRVEYCAASDAYTHAPEGFNEFFNQRRRWVPSTIANIMDLLMDSKHTIKINDNISGPYIGYQILLMGGTILGPGTIFLMLVGACVAVFKIDNWTSFYYNSIPILFFMFVCFTCKPAIQLLVAQMLSTAYALLMMAVIVGTALQLGEDGIGSPSAIFLMCMTGSFFIAACLHPQEFWCVVHFFIYLLSIPAMYLILILYSIINLNVVTWGTREVQTKKTKKELEQERKEAEEAARRAKQKSLLGFLQNGIGENDDDQGSIEFSFAGLFKLMLCTHGKPSAEKQELAAIAEQVTDSVDAIGKRLAHIEKVIDPHGLRRRASSIGSRNDDHLLNIDDMDETRDSETESIKSHRTDEVRQNHSLHQFWLEDKTLKNGATCTIPVTENQFWNELLETYLYPIDEDKADKARIARDLKELRDQSVFGFFMMNALFVMIVFLMQLNKDSIHVKWPFGVKENVTYEDITQEARIAADLIELRNKSVFAFFMFNALFVLIVFLMQLNKDQLHIIWPFGVRTNITIIEETAEVHITKEYLQLEPIGLVFVFFFALILVIQFTAMLFHRFGTFAHILASTTITWFWSTKSKESDIEDTHMVANDLVSFVKTLQKLEDVDEDDNSGSGPARRKTVRNLEKNRRKNNAINTLDVAFRKRFLHLTENEDISRNLPIRRSTKAYKAFEDRRESIVAARRKSQMQTLGANNIYGVAGNPLGIQPRPTRSSQISVKDVFENHGACSNPGYEGDSPRNSVRLQTLTPGSVSSWREPNTNL